MIAAAERRPSGRTQVRSNGKRNGHARRSEPPAGADNAPREVPQWVKEHKAYAKNRRWIDAIAASWPTDEDDPTYEHARGMLDGVNLAETAAREAARIAVPEIPQHLRDKLDAKRFRSALPFEVHEEQCLTVCPNWTKLCIDDARLRSDEFPNLHGSPQWVWELLDSVLEKGLHATFRVPIQRLAYSVALVCRNVHADVMAWFDPIENRLIVAANDAEDRFRKYEDDESASNVPRGKLCTECGSPNLVRRAEGK